MNETTTDRSRQQQRVTARAGAERLPERDDQHPEQRSRTRQRLLSSSPPTHDNYINLSAVPKDVSLEWKRFTVSGQETPFYLQAQRRQGWEPVNPQEHPEWVSLPPGYDATTVIVDGLILMERPMALTLEARADDRLMAERRINEAKQRLGQKTDEGEADRTKPRVVEEIGRMMPQAIEGA